MATEATGLSQHEMREQVPSRLRRFDDPWGLVWRVNNGLRALDVKRSVRLQVARVAPIDVERPILVMGVPRSATTAVFRLLGEHPDLNTLGHEGHDCWRRYQHPRRKGWASDWATADDIVPGEAAFVRRWFGSRLGPGRFVDKTPENAFRVPYLMGLFPDAHVVAVHRDPRRVLSSLLSGWRHPEGRFRSYFVPDELAIADYEPTRQWCYGLIDGWRDLRSAPIPEIVEEQYRQYVRGLVQGREAVAPAQWHDVYVEDLFADPVTITSALLEAMDLPSDPRVLAAAETLPQRRDNAMVAGPVTPPAPAADDDEVAELVSRLASEIASLGYDPDALADRLAGPRSGTV